MSLSATEDDRLLTEENVFAIMRLMQQRGSVVKIVAEAELKDRLDALDMMNRRGRRAGNVFTTCV